MEAILGAEVRELSIPECLDLLATATMGHLGITYKALPIVVPVRIHLADDEVAIESLLGGAIPLSAGAVVALEAGTSGEGLATEWTVEVRGFLTADNDSTSPAPLAELIPSPGRLHLSTEEVSGWSSTSTSNAS
jgi:hypothetical protein